MSNYAFRTSSTTTTKEQDAICSSRSEHSVGNQEQQSLLADITPESIVSDALNWGGLMLTNADDIENSALSDIIPTKDMNGVFAGASALVSINPPQFKASLTILSGVISANKDCCS